jgi:hypothetical protein
MLGLASAVKAVPTPRPDPAAVGANRLRMLDAAGAVAARRQRRGGGPFAWVWGLSSGLGVRPLFRAAVTLAIVVSLVILVAGALFTTAADSYPGQALYPVKRFGENLRLSLTSNPAARQDLQTEYLLERRHEVRQVLDAGKRAVLEFRAELEEIGDDYWIIGGLKVMLDSDTLVEGHAAVGALVVVQASSSGDGMLQAIKLQIQANPLLLTPIISATPTPTPTVTPTPSATPTTTPSTTPTPTPTITLTASPTPTETSSPVPMATATPTYTEEPESTDLPEENETEEPGSTDEPDPTHTEEPESDDEPEPTRTEVPESDDQRKPTATEESKTGDLKDGSGSNEPSSTDNLDTSHAEESRSAIRPVATHANAPEPAASKSARRPLA